METRESGALYKKVKGAHTAVGREVLAIRPPPEPGPEPEDPVLAASAAAAGAGGGAGSSVADWVASMQEGCDGAGDGGFPVQQLLLGGNRIGAAGAAALATAVLAAGSCDDGRAGGASELVEVSLGGGDGGGADHATEDVLHDGVTLGLGRIVALYYGPSALYQVC